MPQHNTVKARCESAHKDSLATLYDALAKPDDKELFYTASLQFLNRRLQEKAHLPPKSRASQSCCLLTPTESHGEPSTSQASPPQDRSIFDETQPGQSLSMHQLLPFPKSSYKDSFFTRLKKTFRKYRRSTNIPETNNSYDADSSNHMSNFKFPRCARRTKDLHPSCLVKISEETSNENVKASNMKDSISKGDVL